MRFSASRGARSVRPVAISVTLTLLVLIGLALASAARSGAAATPTQIRKTFTVNPAVGPGVFVVVACQRGCAIKASASFRITEVLLVSKISCRPCWVGIGLFSLAGRKQVS